MKALKSQNGLTRKTVNCLIKAGIPIEKNAILKALKSGKLYPHRIPRNYGKYTHREICRWVGIESEYRGKTASQRRQTK